MEVIIFRTKQAYETMFHLFDLGPLQTSTLTPESTTSLLKWINTFHDLYVNKCLPGNKIEHICV